jgi:hypothetical protein
VIVDLDAHRQSIRLKGWDYTADAAYFVTICMRNRERLLGSVDRGQMHLTDEGEIVADTLRWLPTRYEVDLDEWCVMPNHLHAILVIRRGGSRTAPPPIPETTPPRTPPTLADRMILNAGTVPPTASDRRPKSIGRAIGPSRPFRRNRSTCGGIRPVWRSRSAISGIV